MPTYQYRCKECGHDFEVVQAFTDDALTECPECKGALKKVYGNVGISFKGSGFYKNDARSGSKKSSTASSESSDSSSKSEPGSTSEKKSDTKADKKDSKKSEKASTASTSKSD